MLRKDKEKVSIINKSTNFKEDFGRPSDIFPILEQAD